MDNHNNNKIKTTCPYCGVGCGLIAESKNRIYGDITHPANFGELCAKGSNLAASLNNNQRLPTAQVNQQPASLEHALDAIAEKISHCINEYGPESVAFYGSGQLLTEDYYVANKLMKGFIGSSNIDTNSRLCMASAVVAHQRAFGEDCVPGCYQDFDMADLVILVGSNAAWTHPIIYRRISEAKQKNPNMKLVVIDPRKTASCAYADLHLAINPDSDIALFNGLLRYLEQTDKTDKDYIEQHTEGFSKALEAASAKQAPLSELCGVPEQQLNTFFHWFSDTDKTVTAYCMGVNQSRCGSDKANAIINCHLATGRIGKPGASPFSLTGQPNAMGGREVGGLATQLAAHMGFETDSIDRVKRFWSAPNITTKPGLKAVDLFQAINAGKIKFLWVMATNPAVSMPELASVQSALEKIPHLVVSDKFPTETSHYADIILPAAGWGEKDGTVTNSERTISRQRSFLPLTDLIKPDWWAICQVAKRLGFSDAFNFESSADIFREHAALSAFENNDNNTSSQSKRIFNLAELSELSDDQYNELPPTQWPLKMDSISQFTSSRLFSDGQFATHNKKAQFIAIPSNTSRRLDKPQASSDVVNKPHATELMLILNTGRERDQWHTRSITGKIAKLNLHSWQPTAKLHPDDLASLGNPSHIEANNLQQTLIIKCQADVQQKLGEVFIPMHWGFTSSNQGQVNKLVTAEADPYSGQPSCKLTQITVKTATINWTGWLASLNKIDSFPKSSLWTEIKQNNQYLYHLSAADDISTSSNLLLDSLTKGALLAKEDSQQQQFTYALAAEKGGFDWWLQLSEKNSSNNLIEQETQPSDFENILQRASLNSDKKSSSRIICSCYSISQNQISQAIDGGCNSVNSLSRKLGCGNNCGVCKPELKAMLCDKQSIELS
ncbi:nitrate reductase [Pelagibaculum spongiae]|uniref:Nitrate reductase n=1 Tax=Pelagibaculum spongiae TaxID=2080658 RepID=A0A2V1GWH8_9GAMM|nr:molybdopterin-dependent oxidoreductase [Pelagibaculum spongiae]PVZ70688.1 nitrate reductase [Pelagibaculum spongiae]